MSQYNRKGYRAIPGRNAKTGKIQSFPVKVGGTIDAKHRRNLKKFKNERTKDFREYKQRMKEIKKRVPIEERSKTNWSRMPERYL